MKPDWRRSLSRRGREAVVLTVTGLFLFAFALIGNSMTRPLDHLLDADDRDDDAVRIVTQHVSR